MAMSRIPCVFLLFGRKEIAKYAAASTAPIKKAQRRAIISPARPKFV